MNKFATLIYELRKEKGLTQSELGDKLGLTDKAISRWENGESYPETGQLVPLSNIFNITVDELLKGERKVKPEELNNIISKDNKALTTSQALQVIAGLAFLIFGVVAIITLNEIGVNYKIYLSIFFPLLAVSIFIFIQMGMNKQLLDNEIDMIKSKSAKRYILQISIGVALFILMPLSLIILDNIVIGFPIFFVILLAGLTCVILGGISWDREINKEIVKNITEREDYHLQIEGKISGVIMLLATAVFLFLGFVFNFWHPGWVVFPIGGILCGISSVILGKEK